MPFHFPVIFQAGPFHIAAHTVFEALGYTLGFLLYRVLKKRRGDIIPSSDRYTVLVVAVLGAAAGSKALYWLEDPTKTLRHATDLNYLLAGKTIVGALLAATLAVEWIKHKSGITRRTGDLFTLPIITGMVIGRIGCFLGGLPDNTFGIPTTLPWGVDFGDGVPRHPTQLYEAAFLLGLGILLTWRARHPYREGDLYRYFLVAYMAFRFAIDFLKPGVAFLGLTAIQWACAAAILAYWRDIRYWLASGSTSWETAYAPTSSTTPPSPSARPVTGEVTPK